MSTIPFLYIQWKMISVKIEPHCTEGEGVQLRALQQKFSGSDSYFVADCIVVNDH